MPWGPQARMRDATPMTMHSRKQVDELLSRFQQMVLGTCGPAGPQTSRAGFEIKGSSLIVKIDRTSDHLFNLESHPDLVMLTPDWELRGTGKILPASANVLLCPWQVAIRVTPTRLHILDRDGLRRIETVDFPTQGV